MPRSQIRGRLVDQNTWEDQKEAEAEERKRRFTERATGATASGSESAPHWQASREALLEFRNHNEGRY
jgi:hypothetical protein